MKLFHGINCKAMEQFSFLLSFFLFSMKQLMINNLFLMAKIHPKSFISMSSSSSSMASSSSSSSSSFLCNFITSKKEAFTIWMKSLVFNGNGCTVYNSNGDIIYRIDNYNKKSSDEVCLMDLRGNVLVTILRKKISVLRLWEGYRWNAHDQSKLLDQKKPWFQVRNPCRILKGDSLCEVKIVDDNQDMDKPQPVCYKIEGSSSKAAYRILGPKGELVAEVKQKQSTTGIVLGDDVMTLVVEPNVDHLLIMSLVVVHSLMHHKM